MIQMFFVTTSAIKASLEWSMYGTAYDRLGSSKWTADDLTVISVTLLRVQTVLAMSTIIYIAILELELELEQQEAWHWHWHLDHHYTVKVNM